ncbi:outer membrane beta-barrel protein [Neiella marina]|uniref:Outer membrane beta-barrel protein n=1 Tax=Neiella holothuriorum TaxID=2870530 RepID=A0ABS7EFK2_9GAMM|nr:outer membrane beta-barrel protein [Neiella holothuriorum]MBW8190571.1 outer membrane beta-barrel protein [Neiella holothuriorum]
MRKLFQSRWMLSSGGLCYLTCASVTAGELFQPNSVPIADSNVRVTPVLTTTFGYDDNLAFSPTDEITSSYLAVRGRANFYGGNEIRHLTMDVDFSNAQFHDSSDDNYLDYGSTLRGHWQATSKHRFNALAAYDYRHEARGQGISEGIGILIDEPVEYSTNRLNMGYEYGVDGAQMNLSGSVGYFDKTYENFRDVTSQRDYSTLLAGLGMSWRLTARMSIIVDGDFEDINYDTVDTGSGSRDNQVSRVLAGVRWQASAETGFYAQFGHQRKDFSNPNRIDFSGNAWKLRGRWAYRPSSNLSLEGSKEARDPNTLGDYVDVESLQVNWKHSWLYQWSTSVLVRYSNKEYVGVTRDDDVWNLGLSTTYEWRRNISTSLGYSYAEVDSTSDAVEYEKNTWQLSIIVAL